MSFYEGREKKSFIHKLGYKYIFKKSCQNSQKIIAVSESTKNDITSALKINPAKVKVIYEAADDQTFNQVDSNIIDQLKAKYQLSDRPVVLYVGQWRPHKNLTGLIEAFDQLKKETDAKLVIVGKIDPAFPEVAETIDKSPNMSDIIRTGFVSSKELAAWYQLAHVFVFPSFYEGFGLPGLEAMAAGAPVVSSDRTSLPEIYQTGAIYFNPSDPIDMSQKILSVIKDEKLRQTLISQGREVIKKYSWRKTAEETLAVYRKID